MEEPPAGNKVLNNSSIYKLISPKTSNLSQSEVNLPPLTSSTEELLSPKPRTITMSEGHVALLSSSIDELLNQTGSSDKFSGGTPIAK